LSKKSANRELFTHRLVEVRALSDHDSVPVPNSSDAVYVIDDEGRRWVKKYVAANDLLAEAFGTLLALDLSVPTANGGYHVDGGETWWLSEYLDPIVHWDPSYAERLADPDELGSLLALDAVIGNTDRHARNIVLRPSPSEHELRVFSIDLANSWLGTPHDLEAAQLAPPPVGNVAKGIPVDMIARGARTCALRAAQLPDDRVVDSAREACMIANEPEEARLVRALTLRLRNAPNIVDKYLKLLRNR